jgi:predicted transcriptional regulator
MAQEKIGEVQSNQGGTSYVYWDKETGKVYTGQEYAGTASSKEQAMIEANYYATTQRTRT